MAWPICDIESFQCKPSVTNVQYFINFSRSSNKEKLLCTKRFMNSYASNNCPDEPVHARILTDDRARTVVVVVGGGGGVSCIPIS